MTAEAEIFISHHTPEFFYWCQPRRRLRHVFSLQPATTVDSLNGGIPSSAMLFKMPDATIFHLYFRHIENIFCLYYMSAFHVFWHIIFSFSICLMIISWWLMPLLPPPLRWYFSCLHWWWRFVTFITPFCFRQPDDYSFSSPSLLMDERHMPPLFEEIPFSEYVDGCRDDYLFQPPSRFHTSLRTFFSLFYFQDIIEINVFRRYNVLRCTK